MTIQDLTPSILVGKGRVVSADYRDPLIPSYRDNPLLEALPPILREEEAITLLATYPNYDESERRLPLHLRLHLVQNALCFFQPLPVHLDLEGRFSRLIRGGYQFRNPVNLGFWRNSEAKIEVLSADKLPPNHLYTSASGFTIIGISGIGKTTAVASILSLYPQVIIHSYYKKQNLTIMQIVWLKLDCPFDGSIKGMCINFFQAVDELLKTNYSKNYAKERRTVDELIPCMARVASLHCIGVLVIDEIQHLNEAKSGGANKMLNFFVQLVNMIGVPVVLVGTYKALSILSGEFRQARRGSGQGDLVWDSMAFDDIWQLFVESLWQYQYVQKSSPLTPSLSHALYDVTQGITDFAVKVYMLAQIRAMTTATEAVTESIIRSVAADSLRLALPILSALKTGNLQVLHSVEDVHPLDITSIRQRATNSTQVIGLLRSSAIVEKNLKSTQLEVIEANNEELDLTKNKQIKPSKKETNKVEDIDGLLAIVTSGSKKGIVAYESLKLQGYIRPASEFLLGEDAE